MSVLDKSKIVYVKINTGDLREKKYNMQFKRTNKKPYKTCF